ncbi:hypothetical protein NP303_25075, partial [Salmonella enterica]|nr:hypothetical protein [Salmonella enterica]
LILKKTETLTQEHDSEKFKIQAGFVRDLKGDHIKGASQGPSNIFLQPISRDSSSNTKNDKSPKIAPKTGKGKTLGNQRFSTI